MTDYYLAEVISTTRLTPSMIRVELAGDDLSRFRSSGKPDEWVRLLFPREKGKAINLPAFVEGKWERPDGPMRPYTVRKWDPSNSRMNVDFVAHEGGVAAEWAISAKIGDRIGLTCAEGRFNVPDDAQWVLLFADVTGLPAVGRILEEIKVGTRVITHVEIPREDDRQPFDTSANLSLHWHVSFGRYGKSTHLLDIAQSAELPDGPGYIWIAGQAVAAFESRKHFRDVLGFDKSRIEAVGYWIEGQARG